MLDLWGNIGFLVLTFSSLIFTFLYLTSSRWYKSFMGSLIAVFLVCVVVLTTYLSLRVWDIEVPGVEWVRLIIFWLLGISMLSAIVGFIEVQFGSRATKLRNRLSKRYSDVRKDDTSLER
jgi:hypothetical protein